MIDRPAEKRDFYIATAGVALLAMCCMVYASRSRGIWLDEFWSIRLGDANLPFTSLVETRWLSDTHPPLPNLLYHFVTLSGADVIEWRRIVLNFPALLAMTASTIFFTRNAPGRRAFPTIFFVMALALSGTIEALSDYRSYGWQISAICILLQYLHLVFYDNAAGRSWVNSIGGGLAIIASIALHYVTGIIVSIVICVTMAMLVQNGRWRSAVAIFIPAAIAWAGMLVSGIILLGRMKRDIDVGWIVTSPVTGALLFVFLIGMTVAANPLAAWFAATARGTLTKQPRSFAIMLAISLVLSAVALMLLNAATPILIERYLIGWQLLLCALLAILAESALGASITRFVAFIAIGILMLSIATANAASAGGWRTGRDIIAAEVRHCPATQIFAMSAWRMKAAHASNAARRETEVIDAAYHQLAGEGGFRVNMLDLSTPAVLLVRADCPTLLWAEHLDWDNVRSIDYLQRAGHIRFDNPAATTMRRTGSGFVISATADQNRRAMPK